jgi:hypothetical protein
MKNSILAGLFTASTVYLSSSGVSPVHAQTCDYYAGQAVGGQSINVNLCSISQASQRSVNFVYFLGDERIQSQANCEAGTWTTFPERAVHRPQSLATQNMLNTVCSYRSSRNRAEGQVVFVFDPPSNVRVSPNGRVLCSINQAREINVYGATGSWYYTDACGQTGVIHSSQIRF